MDRPARARHRRRAARAAPAPPAVRARPGRHPGTPPGTPPGGTPGKGAETKTPPGTPPGTTPPGATGPTGSAADLVPVLEAATAIILSPGGHGSGFFIGRNMVVTNRHVVKEPYPGNKVYLASRKFGTVLEGTVIAAAGTGQAGGSDFAVIRVDDQVPAHIKPLPLAAEPASLKQVVAAGYPGAVVRNDRNFIDLIKGDPSKAPELVLTRGEISAVQNRERGIPSVAHTAAISSGNSGGPLVDSCGRVVGINTFGTKAEAGPGGGFALGSTGIANFLKSSDVPFDWQEVACAK
ncbi:MAG: trypsin-like peptidase domain-containing protein [Rhodospirillales bacterium]|nr:MAG: trypsin-like peptidase domain-containing protein [Rhodospirillales bacterium]